MDRPHRRPPRHRPGQYITLSYGRLFDQWREENQLRRSGPHLRRLRFLKQFRSPYLHTCSRRPFSVRTKCCKIRLPWLHACPTVAIFARRKSCKIWVALSAHLAGYFSAPWHFLYFFPEPQGQGSLRPTFSPVRAARAALASPAPALLAAAKFALLLAVELLFQRVDSG